MNAELDTLEININDNARKTAKGIDELTGSLAALKSVTNGGVGLEDLFKETTKIKGMFSGISSGKGGIGSLKSKLNFGAVTLGAKKAITKLNDFVTKSTEYVETLNLFNVSMGEYAKEAKNYANEVANVMGIDPGTWMKGQGVFMTLATGFGIAGEKASFMSKNLTQLAYDIASFFNIGIEDAMQKLQSGISGELEPLRRLGYDLSQARLEATALSLGIDKSVSSMTQAEKAQIRYYTIMNQVTQVQGDMARTLEQPANQLRIFQAALTQTGRAIGNIFIPALNTILPYAIAVVKVVQWVADSVASLFGFEIAEVDYSGIDTLIDGAGEAEDALGGAAGAAKELKRQVMGFDELNILNDPNVGGGGAAGGGGFSADGFDFELPGYDFLGDAVSSKATKIFEEIKKGLEKIIDLVPAETFVKLKDSFNGLVDAWNSFKKNEAFEQIVTFIDLLAATGIEIAINSLADGLNLLSGHLNFIASLSSGDFSGAIDALSLIQTSVYNLITGPISTFSGNIHEFFNNLIWGDEANIPQWILDIQEYMENYFWPSLMPGSGGMIGVTLGNTIKELGGLSGVGEKLQEIWEGVKTSWNGFKTWTNANFVSPIKAFFENLWDNVTKKANETWENVKEAFSPAVEWFSEWFGNVWTTVSDVFTNIGIIAAGTWTIVKEAWNKANEWFDEEIMQPISLAFAEAWEYVATKASDAWEAIKEVFSTVGSFFKDTFSKAWEKVVEVFSVSGEIFVDIKDGITAAFKTVVNGLISGINWVIARPFNAINSALSVVRNVKILGLSPFSGIGYISVPEIPYLASGGYGIPNGQLFIANESGPELVGQMNGKNTVANQEQIIEGIRQATYEGFMAAMASNTNENGETTIVLQVGEDTFGSIVTKALNKQTRELGYLALEGI